MSQSNSVREALTATALSIANYLDDAQGKALMENEGKMRSAIDKEADRFFAYIRDYIILWESGSTPGLIRPYTSWAPLTRAWMLKKARKSRRSKKSDLPSLGTSGANTATKHYRGLFGHFSQHIKNLARSGNANRLLGKPITQMAFGDGTSNVVIDRTVVTSKGRVNYMGYRADGKYGFITAKGAQKSVIIKAFPNLQGVPANEVDLAKWMGEQTGRKDQWMKVYSTHNNRPVRAILLPLVRWYVDVGFPRAIQKVLSK